ncbi:SRPBCC family protein [Kribbella speibonae]|uniref:SRPBCC family protein n=1 Tax=Kribbella speibonae TaxID=1572660 RepID=A0ABY2A886_9ACTN|nr:SRPBCC family protein [Kribbella speibonae]TCC25296.1 SRPBCC family protein [Kribbella speibonae]
MGEHEAWTTIDVAPNVVFERLSDLEHLPRYLPWLSELHRTGSRPVQAQGPEARRPHQAVREEVDVTAEGDERHEGWIDVLDEDRVLRWGADGPREYQGELAVDFVADGTSKLTVRLRTTHDVDVDGELRQVLGELKTTLEHESEHASGAPDA